MRRILADTRVLTRTGHLPNNLKPHPPPSAGQRQQLAMASSLPSPPYTPEKPPAVSLVTGLAFWNTHVPPHQQTKDCPSFLQYAFKDHRDRACLATYDKDYIRPSWADVQELIQTNQLDGFRRVPSELRRYREYTAGLTRDYGSVMNFVMQERLRWDDLTPSGAAPFENREDYKILFNDWPYGIDTRIVHLVVWTKFELEPEPITAENPKGDLTPKARQQINDYVDRTFGEECGKENVIWFKNWSALKSVHAVEHFHVMILDPEPTFIQEITEDDVPLAEKVGRAGEERSE